MTVEALIFKWHVSPGIMKAMQTSHQAQSTLSMSELLEFLDLKPAATELPETSAWIGTPQTVPSDRVYGGLQLAQAIVAAGKTVPADQSILTLQADFIGGVPTDGPLTWHVEHVADTPTFSTRRSSIMVNGRELFTALTRWGQTRSDLPSYSHTTPQPVTVSPEELPSLYDRYHDDDRIPLWWRITRPVNAHPVAEPPYVTPVEQGTTQTTMLHPTGQVPADPVIQAALAGYATDMSILEPAFRASGALRHAPKSRILTLTHALTFHQMPTWDSWLQFDAYLESLSNGRALGTGELFDLDGTHLVSASQVGFVKFGAFDGTD